MLASVLNSQMATRVSVQVVRAFIKLREAAISHKDLAPRITESENRYDNNFRLVFDALR